MREAPWNLEELYCWKKTTRTGGSAWAKPVYKDGWEQLNIFERGVSLQRLPAGLPWRWLDKAPMHIFTQEVEPRQQSSHSYLITGGGNRSEARKLWLAQVQGRS